MEFPPPHTPSASTLIHMYGRTERPFRRFGRYMSDFVVTAGLVGTLVLAMTALGKFKTIFSDFHLQLPWMTRALMDFHAAYDAYYGWIIVWIIPLTAPLVLSQAEGRSRRRWFLAAFCLIAVLAVLAIVAMFSPMTQLIQQTSSTK